MSHRSNPFRKLKSALGWHSAAHAAPSGRRHAANLRTSGWGTFEGWLQPETKQDGPYVPPAQVPAMSVSATLPPLPPGSMAQRGTGQNRPMPPRTAYPAGAPSPAELSEAARRVTGTFSGHFRLNGDVPLFRGDDMTWAQFDERRMERLRRMQDLANPWSDAHGVNLGASPNPKTLVYSTSDYARFADGTGMIPAVKR